MQHLTQPSRPGHRVSEDKICDGAVLILAGFTLLANAVVRVGGSLFHLTAAALATAVLTLVLVLLRRNRRGRSSDPHKARVASQENESPLHEDDAGPTVTDRLAVALSALACIFLLARTGDLTLFTISGTVLLILLAAREFPAGPASCESSFSPGQRLVLAILSVTCVLLVLITHRFDADDGFFLNIAVAASDHPRAPLLSQDTMHGLDGIPFLLSVYRVQSIELLHGMIAYLTRLRVIEIAHILSPAVFAALIPVAYGRLLRLLTPRHLVLGVFLALAFLLSVGETHYFYGNFGFVRLHQGKAVLVSLFVPLIIAYAYEFAYAPGVRSWVKLAAAQIAAVGMSCTALWLAPIVGATALLCAIRTGKRPLRTLVLGFLASGYVVFLAAVFRNRSYDEVGSPIGAAPFPFVWAGAGLLVLSLLVVIGLRYPGLRKWYPKSAIVLPLILLVAALIGLGGDSVEHATSGKPAGQGLAQKALGDVLGDGWIRHMVLFVLLGSWSTATSALGRRFATLFALLFLWLLWNPFVAEWAAGSVTGPPVYWRVFWMVPLPALVALAIVSILSLPVPRAIAWSRYLLCGIVAGVVFFLAPEQQVLSSRNEVDWRLPGPKVPRARFEAAQAIAEQAGAGSFVLAPRKVSLWIPTLPDYPSALVVRSTYLHVLRDQLPVEEVEKRQRLWKLVSGKDTSDGGSELLRSAVREYPLEAVGLTKTNSTGELRRVLRQEGLEKVFENSEYEVWARAEGWSPDY